MLMAPVEATPQSAPRPVTMAWTYVESIRSGLTIDLELLLIHLLDATFGQHGAELEGVLL
jgi:hypothetical protein